MYHPHFRKNKGSVPILSRKEINIIAENYAVEFMPEILTDPQPFDIDGFTECYLNLTLDYQYLSNDGRYLGMTVFNNTNKVPVYVPKYECAEYIRAENGTVIIDNSLLDEKQENRYRFTLGHECGHWIFHRDYFDYNPNQLTLFEISTPFHTCREINRNYLRENTSNWDETRWMEWQADQFAAGILMPESSVHCLYETQNGWRSLSEYQITQLLTKVYNVSEQAAYLRLCNLNYIHRVMDESKYQQLSFL